MPPFTMLDSSTLLLMFLPGRDTLTPDNTSVTKIRKAQVLHRNGSTIEDTAASAKPECRTTNRSRAYPAHSSQCGKGLCLLPGYAPAAPQAAAVHRSHTLQQQQAPSGARSRTSFIAQDTALTGHTYSCWRLTAIVYSDVLHVHMHLERGRAIHSETM